MIQQSKSGLINLFGPGDPSAGRAIVGSGLNFCCCKRPPIGPCWNVSFSVQANLIVYGDPSGNTGGNNTHIQFMNPLGSFSGSFIGEDGLGDGQYKFTGRSISYSRLEANPHVYMGPPVTVTRGYTNVCPIFSVEPSVHGLRAVLYFVQSDTSTNDSYNNDIFMLGPYGPRPEFNQVWTGGPEPASGPWSPPQSGEIVYKMTGTETSFSWDFNIPSPYQGTSTPMLSGNVSGYKTVCATQPSCYGPGCTGFCGGYSSP